jgi:hypothetical protein
MFSSRSFTSHLHYIYVLVVLDYSCCKYYLWYPLESSHWLGVSDWNQLKLGFSVTQLESITTHDPTLLEPTVPFAYVFRMLARISKVAVQNNFVGVATFLWAWSHVFGRGRNFLLLWNCGVLFVEPFYFSIHTDLSILQFGHIQCVFDGKKYENIYHKYMSSIRPLQVSRPNYGCLANTLYVLYRI